MCVQWSLHVLSCPKGGLVITRYNELWKLTAEILGEVCKNVVIEPLLAPLTGEELSKSLNTCNQAWANAYELEGHGWTGKAAFCDVRVFNPLAKCNLHHSLPAVYKNNENEKKREYNSEFFKLNMDPSHHLCFHVEEIWPGNAVVSFRILLNFLLPEEKNLKARSVHG